jgi:nickel-dependent lactate racemase
MSNTSIDVPHRAWYGDESLTLSFPRDWQVTCCPMAGADRAVLTPEQLADALARPIGSPRLSELARGRRRAVILFDDFTRPQPTSAILPAVLDELHAAGLGDDDIRFVTAYGCHRAMTSEEMAKKLGEEIVARHLVFNHTIYDHLVECGTTKRGTPVRINREVVEADLRIAIGGVVPHLTAGFGGGGKMMIHVKLMDQQRLRENEGTGEGLGRIENNVFRAELEEAARIAGLHFKVDLITNGRREIIGLFAGDFVDAHRQACRFASEIYATDVVRDADIVVANTYPIECQVVKGAWPAVQSVRDGGTVVVLTHSPDGVSAHHFLVSRFGTDYGGAMYRDSTRLWLARAARVIVLTDRLTRCDRELFGPADRVTHARTWSDALRVLEQHHPGRPTVAVYPYSAVQMPNPPSA